MQNVNRENTCCFTGHRPSKLPWKTDESDPRCRKLKKTLYEVAESVYQAGIRHFICGMAEGCDLYFAEELFRLRENHAGITVEAAIPCETQAAAWSEEQRNRYFRDVAACDRETMVSRAYTRGCMAERNRYMVDASSVLIAVYDGTLGGTMQTVHYAKKKNLEIILLRP